MPNPPRSPGSTGDDEGWSTPTRVQFGGGAEQRPQPPRQQQPRQQRQDPPRQPTSWQEPPRQRAGRPPQQQQYREPPRYRAPVPVQERRPPERGLPGWAALLVLIVIAGIGAAIDNARGTSTGGGFNIGIVVASIVAILVVRRSGMFPVVIAPPIVYSLGSAFILYLRSGGLSDRHVLYDAASNWLVYGFPAIAAATAAVLIVCGFRLITRR